MGGSTLKVEIIPKSEYLRYVDDTTGNAQPLIWYGDHTSLTYPILSDTSNVHGYRATLRYLP